MSRKPDPHAPSQPSPLAGEGDPSRGTRRGSGEGSDDAAKRAPSPRLASLATPLPQGERENRICVAKIGAAHGVRGEVRLWSFTEDPLAVTRYGPLETQDGARQFEIASARVAKDHLVARLAGIDDRGAAETLNNLELYVPRARLPAPQADEFYHADLIGLAAIGTGGETLGRVVAVHNYGAGDILEIAPPQGATLLLPFSHAVVPKIDIAGGTLTIDMPDEIEGDDPAQADS